MAEANNRDHHIRRIILIEGSVNLLVLLLKLAVGIATGSLAVLGDAIHSLTDVANNIVAWIVIRLSAMPADREHPYGHRKFETLAVFGLASLLAVLAFELALHAVKREPMEVVSGPWELAIMLSVLVVNIALASWQRFWARRLQSDILLADASHTFADVLITLVVIGGWQLSAMGYLWLDRLCALGVAMLVLYLSYQLFKRATPALVDQFAVDPEALTRAVMTIDGVKHVDQVRSRWIGKDRAVDLVISVRPELTTEQSHQIADRVESLIEKRFQVTDVSTHVEPFVQNSPGDR